MRRALLTFLPLASIVSLSLFTLLVPPAAAQDGDRCRDVYFASIATMLDNCAGLPGGSLCWAVGEDIVIDTTSGQLVSGPGTTVPYGVVTAFELPPNGGDLWRLVRVHLTDMVDYTRFATLLAMGPLAVEVVADDTLPPGHVLTLQTGSAPPCDDLARPGLLVQSPENSLTLLRVNGVELAINGTAVLHAPEGQGLTVNTITRETILSASGTVVFAGYSATLSAPDADPTIAPYDPAAVAHLPTETLPSLEIVPLPGNATVTEESNLYFRPEPEAYSTTTIAAGLPVSILGQDTSGAWLHIRTYNGTTAWMPRSVLDVQVPVEPPAYDTPPRPPSRPFGPLQASGVTTSEYNNLREGPGTTYDIALSLPLHSPVDVYARSPDNEWLLVETEDGERAWLYIDLFLATTDFEPAELPYSPDYLPE